MYDVGKTASRDPATVGAPHPGVWRLWFSELQLSLELSHAHIRDEESYDSPGGQFPARRRKFPARLNKFPVRRELIPCFIL